MSSIGVMLLDFCIVVGVVLGSLGFVALFGYILYRIGYRIMNLYLTVEQHMSVRMLESKGIVEVDDDRRMVVIDTLKGFGVSFADACKFITEVNKNLNEDLGEGHSDKKE